MGNQRTRRTRSRLLAAGQISKVRQKVAKRQDPPAKSQARIIITVFDPDGQTVGTIRYPLRGKR